MKKNVFCLFILALVLISCPDGDNSQPETVATPTANPQAGTYATAQTVTLSTATQGAEIRYTTNGNEPTAGSTRYNNPINVNSTRTIKAIAIKDGMNPSGILTATYTINNVAATPTASPQAGTYATAQTVTLSTTTQGAAIRYTTNGSDPNASSTLYSSPITVSQTTTIKAIAIKDGMTNSAVMTAAYTINSVTTPIVRSRTNIDYAPDGSRRHSRQRYDLRLPDTGEGPFPLLIYVHGGGFSGGDWQLAQNNNGLVSLARSRGYAVASVGYLLMGQSGWSGGQRAFPENVEDVLAAVRHLRANAAEYRLDSNRFAISGFSAGAYMTAIVCALSNATGHGYDVTSLGNPGVSHAVQAAASTAALTNFALLNTHQNQNTGVTYFLDHDATPEGAMLGGNLKDSTTSMINNLTMQNPLTHITAATPPIYMLHGTTDNLVPWPQSQIMVNKVNEFVPNKAVFNQVAGRGHEDFPAAANQITITILDFLDATLGIQR
jgi:acetyl esterase/lipase